MSNIPRSIEKEAKEILKSGTYEDFLSFLKLLDAESIKKLLLQLPPKDFTTISKTLLSPDSVPFALDKYDPFSTLDVMPRFLTEERQGGSRFANYRFMNSTTLQNNIISQMK